MCYKQKKVIMEDWKERVIAEQAELKEKLINLVQFINSEKFSSLSENYKKVLMNQKIAMELYLNVLNLRAFEDIDNIIVPDYSTLSAFASVFSKPFTQI